MRCLPLLLCLFLYACQDPDPAPEAPAPEEKTAAPIPDLVQPAGPTGIPLQAINFTDSAKLVPDLALSPQATYRISTFAARSDDEAFNTVVNTALANLIAGEEAPIRTTNLRKVIVNSVKTQLLNYKKQAVDTAEISKNPEAWILDVNYNTWVLHNANGLLTLATEHDFYTGGPHGNYYTVLHNFDIIAGKQLTYEDIFQAESENQLLSLLKMAAPEQKNIYPTKNVALTKDGLSFDYPPYEINSYVNGEIEVLLPYAKVESLLSETGRNVIQRIGGL